MLNTKLVTQQQQQQLLLLKKRPKTLFKLIFKNKFFGSFKKICHCCTAIATNTTTNIIKYNFALYIVRIHNPPQRFISLLSHTNINIYKKKCFQGVLCFFFISNKFDVYLVKDFIL